MFYHSSSFSINQQPGSSLFNCAAAVGDADGGGSVVACLRLLLAGIESRMRRTELNFACNVVPNSDDPEIVGIRGKTIQIKKMLQYSFMLSNLHTLF